MVNLNKIKQLENIYDACGGGKICHMNHIYDASTPMGKCPMMKVLQTNKCSSDCKYCVNSSKTRQTNLSFTPEELSSSFLTLSKTHSLDGFFLSSAIEKDSEKTTEKMIETVKLVRKSFKGYIHFKVLPGTSYDQIKEVAPLVNRMSINIETPNKSRLSELSGIKDYKADILRRQAWIKKLHGNQTTQLIVGATDETDMEILRMVDWEYENFDLKRIYYSAFKAVKGIEIKKKSESLIRQNRLYNVDFLMKKYFFKLKEFREIMDNDMLPKQDPKLVLAKINYDGPVEINEASYEELLRVPGIGPGTVNRVIALRKRKTIEKYSQLYEIGVRVKNAKPFIKVDGKWQKRLVDFS